MPSQQLKECPARKLVAGLPTRVSGSAGHVWIGAVVPEADLAAALSAPCPCEEERLKLLGALQCSNAAAKRRDTIIETLRRRIHQVERHNQFFERCESGWCNASPKEDPTTEGVGMAWKTPAEYEAERDSLRADLAASQERERLLREALKNAREYMNTAPLAFAGGPNYAAEIVACSKVLAEMDCALATPEGTVRP